MWSWCFLIWFAWHETESCLAPPSILPTQSPQGQRHLHSLVEDRLQICNTAMFAVSSGGFCWWDNRNLRFRTNNKMEVNNPDYWQQWPTHVHNLLQTSTSAEWDFNTTCGYYVDGVFGEVESWPHGIKYMDIQSWSFRKAGAKKITVSGLTMICNTSLELLFSHMIRYVWKGD